MNRVLKEQVQQAKGDVVKLQSLKEAALIQLKSDIAALNRASATGSRWRDIRVTNPDSTTAARVTSVLPSESAVRRQFGARQQGAVATPRHSEGSAGVQSLISAVRETAEVVAAINTALQDDKAAHTASIISGGQKQRAGTVPEGWDPQRYARFARGSASAQVSEILRLARAWDKADEQEQQNLENQATQLLDFINANAEMRAAFYKELDTRNF